MTRQLARDCRLWITCFLWGSLAFGQMGWADEADRIPGTQKLVMSDPLDVVMVNGIDKFALRELDDSPNRREAWWKRDYSSAEAYSKSVAANRQRFLTSIGTSIRESQIRRSNF